MILDKIEKKKVGGVHPGKKTLTIAFNSNFGLNKKSKEGNSSKMLSSIESENIDLLRGSYLEISSQESIQLPVPILRQNTSAARMSK